MYAIQYDEDIIVVDAGAKFPDEGLPGIDLVIPDVTYLLENRDRVRALVVTHGHEDHIGGVSYFLKQLNVPIYATRITLGLIDLKLQEHGLQRETELHTITLDSELQFGGMRLTFFRTNHSIPDCLGIAFHTPEGVVVHTGDFRFDLTPVNGQYPDIHKMARIGEEGVLLLISESTNAERPGFTPSEQMVGKHMEEAFLKAQRKIFVSTFASNVVRVQQVVEAAMKTNRKLALLGRSMVNVVNVAMEQGYLHIPEGMLIEQQDINTLPPERVAVLCTGSQGEPMAALARLATNSFRGVEVLPEDTIILAASPIPGNERNVSRMIDNLFALRARVIYGSGSSTGMHVSGHGYQEELKLMLTLMKPKYFVPIHGEFRMLHHHRQLAESVGVKPENIFIIKNGDVVDIQGGEARCTRTVPAGNVYVDGLSIGEVGTVVLRDRKQLAEDGMLVVIVTLSRSEGKIISGPDIISRGFVHMRDSEDLIRELTNLVATTMRNLQREHVHQWSVMKKEMKEKLSQFVFARTKRRPMILPVIIEV
ncbi:ribonuclease J [Ectobacillus sp. SYSU M60031]|uniref:Ribonuclease J n=2 Tax=Ectobacillus ponti TaxID=2961894 RepID=A0AA42BU13_9BACI|nr:ribonuclease J [Ectobacillus ponti]